MDTAAAEIEREQALRESVEKEHGAMEQLLDYKEGMLATLQAAARGVSGGRVSCCCTKPMLATLQTAARGVSGFVGCYCSKHAGRPAGSSQRIRWPGIEGEK